MSADQPYPGKSSHPGYHMARAEKKLYAELVWEIKANQVWRLDCKTPEGQRFLKRIQNQARIMHLVHRYLRGRTYRGAEPKTHQPLGPNMIERIEMLARMYGGPIHGNMPPVREWVKAN